MALAWIHFRFRVSSRTALGWIGLALRSGAAEVMRGIFGSFSASTRKSNTMQARDLVEAAIEEIDWSS